MRTRQIFTFVGSIAIVALFMLGCEAQTNPNVYSREQAQRLQRVQWGEVTSIRAVEIEGSKSGAGAVAGGVGGYFVGSTIGQGSGKNVARALGTIGGAIAGAAIEEGVTHRRGIEVTVRLNSGESVSIVQGTDERLMVGDRVRIISSPDGSARAVR